MSIESQGFKMSCIADADLSAKQYHYVKFTGNNTVGVCDALTDIPCGILQNTPPQDGVAEVLVSGISKLVASEAMAINILVGTDADGHGITVDPDGATDYYYTGRVMIASGGANEVCSVLVDCSAPVIASKSSEN